MKSTVLKPLALLSMYVLASSAGLEAVPEPQQKSVPTPTSARNSYGQLPMYFEKNEGQTDAHVQFIGRAVGYTLFLSSSEATFSLKSAASNSPNNSFRHHKWNRKRAEGADRQHVTVLRMKFSGGNLASTIQPGNKLPGTVNYLVGRDPKNWHTGIPTYSAVQVSDVYPGVDVVYYGSQRQLEYDFVVKPGADVNRVGFEFEGAHGVSMSQTGEVLVDSEAGRLTIRKPSIYQMENGLKRPVDGNFVMRDGQRIGVEVKKYDSSKALVIDPVLSYSTYLGGSGQDLASGVAVDSQGYAYVGGYTNSINFPTVGTSISSASTGNTMAFVSKLNQSGTGLVYSTYLGGSLFDAAQGISVDEYGQSYIAGFSSSPNFPVTTSNAFQSNFVTGATFNAFLSKLSADGTTLLYSTYLGGSADDEAMSVAVDRNQNAFLTGSATSANFPVTSSNAFQTTLNSVNGNAFVTRIDTTQSGSNSLIYSTFVGGSSPYSFNNLPSGSFGGDAGLSIAVDSNENAYITGEASSTDFPVTASTSYQTRGNANNSVFLTELSTNQSGASSLLYSTFLGGTGSEGDLGEGIALDSQGGVYLTGTAFSTDFPTTVGNANSGVGKVFATKLNPNLRGTASLIYSTLIGGTGGDSGWSIVVDADGNAYFGGSTSSSDFPVTSNAIQTALPNSSSSGFIATLSSDGSSLLYATYFGGSGTTYGDYVNAVAMDANGNLYFAGQTDSMDIPTTQGVFQSSLDGALSAFVGKVTGIVSPAITGLSTTSASEGSPVTIIGSNLGEIQGASKVAFNGMQATVTSWSTSQIIAIVPTGATPGPLTVTVGGATLTAISQFGIVPNIISISPSSGPAGTAVTIIGSGFGPSMGSGTVVLGTATGAVANWTDNQITAVVSPTSATGFVQVQQGGLTSNVTGFAVSSPPTLSSISPASGATGSQVTFTGSGFGTVQGNGMVLLGNTFGIATNWSDTQVTATVAPGAATGTAQVIQGGVSSNAFSFTVTASMPTITAVSPATGSAGTHVTITGSGFGATQGSARLVLGTSNGVMLSWSDAQIVASVALGSSSGVVQVQRPGASSNSVSFAVSTPTISSVSPTTAAAGTQVAISGTSFGGVQGSGNVWLGSNYGSVVSWSDTLVVATVAAGSGSGYAQILQNGVWSNQVSFNTNVPTIVSISPNAGTAGTQITISGSGFGASPNTLQLGTLPGIISTWSDAQIVAKVAASSITGIAQVQQGALLSNSVRFVVPTTGNRNSVILNPSKINMLVGQTQNIQAFTPAGAPVTGLTWTSSDTTVLSLSTDDPPVLTAVAPGHATVTAGDSSCDVTVWPGSSLPIGTVQWSAPGDDSGVNLIIPAAPSPAGVADTFAVQNSGTVQAITSDGQVAWTATLDPFDTVNADFLGGLVETTASSVARFDGLTGQKTVLYTYASPANVNTAFFGTDGTIFTIDGGSVVGLDPTTNAVKFTVAMDRSTYSRVQTCESTSTVNTSTPPSLGSRTIAGDGNFYISYQYTKSFYSDVPVCAGTVNYSVTNQFLLRVGPDGTSSKTFLGGSTATDEVYYFNSPYNGGFTEVQAESGESVVVTSIANNADQGVILSVSIGGSNAYCSSSTSYSYPYNSMSFQVGCVPVTNAQPGVFSVGGTGPTPQPGPWNNFTPVLQAVDGTFYGTTGDGSLSVLDLSGNVKWSAPGYFPLMLTPDGSVIAQSNGQFVKFDLNGVATDQLPAMPIQSWSGNGYQLGSVDQVTFAPLDLMASFLPQAGGNASGSGTPVQPVTQQVRQMIANIAQGYVGSQNWLDTQGLNKCNLFVHDVIKQAGTSPPQSDKTGAGYRIKYYLGLVDTPNYPAQAGDWANPGKTLGQWQTLFVPPTNASTATRPPDISQPGDIIAEAIKYSDATGHVGVIKAVGHTISADSAVSCYAPPALAGTITDSDYGFRPDNWVDPVKNAYDPLTGAYDLPCRNHGYEKNAVVKRFYGQ